MRVSVCVGNYAAVPYCVPGVGINVYCMEELCFVLRENTFLLDLSVADDELPQWIDRECGLRDLSRALRSMRHRQETLSAYVALILDFVGLYDERAVEEARQELSRGAGLSGVEKKKTQMDFLVRRGQYRQALKGYEGLLGKWQEQTRDGEAPAVECLARIWHNKGVAQAGLMLYHEAAESFHRAYELTGEQDFCRAFLAAERMAMTEREYVAFAAQNQESRDLTLELEKDMEQLAEEWERQPERRRLCGGAGEDRRGENERLIRAMKDSYRMCAAD